MKKILILFLSLFLLTGCSSNTSDTAVEYKSNSISTSFQNVAYYTTDFEARYKKLDKTSKKLYREIYYAIYDRSEKLVTSVNVNYIDVNDLLNQVLYDHPEIFWVEKCSLSSETGDTIITFYYNRSKSQIESAKKQITSEISNVLAETKKLSSKYDKLKYIYNYVINKTAYQSSATDNQQITSVFLNGLTVCTGYTKTFQYLSLLSGINVSNMLGYSNTDNVYHIWNIVYLDKETYYVDATWGDSPRLTMPLYQYFMFNSNQLALNYHNTEEDANNKTYANKYNYFVKEDLIITDVDSQLANKLAAAKNNNQGYLQFQVSDSYYETVKTKLKDGSLYNTIVNVGINPANCYYYAFDSSKSFLLTF